MKLMCTLITGPFDKQKVAVPTRSFSSSVPPNGPGGYGNFTVTYAINDTNNKKLNFYIFT